MASVARDELLRGERHLPANQVVNRLRGGETVSLNTWTTVPNTSKQIAWEGKRALVLLSVSQFANDFGVGGPVVAYRLVRTSPLTELAGGETKWVFLHSTFLEHHGSLFVDAVTLPFGTYAVAVQWKTDGSFKQAQGDTNDNIACIIVPTE
jgi:hypothetical protein